MFNTARFKLTLWYSLIIAVITVAFSVIIYSYISREIERFERLQRARFYQGFYVDILPIQSPELLEETRHRIIWALGLIDISIIAFSTALGYFLAGRTLAPIQNMLDEQNRFISDASHELRTPLTSLKSAMEVSLRDPKLTLADAKTLLTQNIEDVNKLSSLSNSLLQLSRSKQAPDGHTILQLSRIAIDSVKKIAPLAQKKNITIQNQVKNSKLLGNHDRLVELLIILLDNAVKYSPVDSTVVLKSSAQNGHVAISVTDQGMGITKEHLPHIFDRFYRADSSRSEGGYGLGLSIAQKIAQSHHGNITVQSKINHGSTFTLRLPKAS